MVHQISSSIDLTPSADTRDQLGFMGCTAVVASVSLPYHTQWCSGGTERIKVPFAPMKGEQGILHINRGSSVRLWDHSRYSHALGLPVSLNGYIVLLLPNSGDFYWPFSGPSDPFGTWAILSCDIVKNLSRSIWCLTSFFTSFLFNHKLNIFPVGVMECRSPNLRQKEDLSYWLTH